jgi:hypothetical protein
MSVLSHSMEPGARPLTRPALRRAAVLALASALALGAAACGGAEAAAPPGHRPPPSSTTTTTTTGPPSQEEAVRRAYLQSWADYARAVWTLDPSGLDRTYADDGLADIEVEIQQLVSAHHRALVDVSHDFTVVLIGDTRASVTDRTVEASVAYDAAANVPAEPRTPHTRLFQMLLDKIDGHWKVVFSA